MKKQRMGGFTIIETLLFLAGSSFLIIIAMTSISGRNREIQFTDSMRGLQSFISQRINFAQNGVARTTETYCRESAGNYDITVTSSDGSCLLLGYVFELSTTAPNNERLLVHKMFGRNLDINDTCFETNADSPFFCARVRAVGTPEVYDIPWGTRFTRSIPANSIAFGYLRSPSNGAVYPIVYNNNTTPTSLTNPLEYRLTATNTSIGSEVDSRYCFASPSSRRAIVSIGQARNDTSVGLDFNNTSGCL